MSVGIERLQAYLPAYVMLRDGGTTAESRDVRRVAVAPPCEDVVALAATAGARLLRKGFYEPASIGLVVLATTMTGGAETPPSVLVHDLLQIGPHCRTLDVRHPGYGGVAGLMAAAEWVRAGGLRPRRALVIAADVPADPIAAAALGQGAGAVAMLVSYDPQTLILGEDTGVATVGEERDTIHGYHRALEAAFLACRAFERPALGVGEGLSDRLGRIIYQTTPAVSAWQAHRRLVEIDWRAAAGRWAEVERTLETAARESYGESVADTLGVLEQAGDVGTAQIGLALAALVETLGRRLGGRRVGCFAYGSGGAEFFTGFVPARIETVADTSVARLLEQQVVVDAADQVRRWMGEGPGGEPPAVGFAGEFVFRGVRGGQREYVRVDEGKG